MSNGWQVCITCWSIIPVGHVSVCAVGCLPPLVAVSSPPSPCLCFCRTAGDGSPPDSPSPPSATQQHSESGLRMDLVFGHNTSDISQSSIIGRKHCKCFFPTANFTCPRPLGRGLCHYQGNPLRPWLQELAVFLGQCWHLDPHSPVLTSISGDKSPLNQLPVKKLFFSLIIKTFCH